MSKFRQLVENILKEAKQVGDLYHSTTFDNLLNILRDNRLEAYPRYTGGKKNLHLDLNSLGISVSRTKFFMYKGLIEIILDGNKLSEKYAIYPYNYFNDNPTGIKSIDFQDVEESVIISKSYINNIKKYSETHNEQQVYWAVANNPFGIDNINKYIKGFILSPSVFSSRDLISALLDLTSQTDKPFYSLRGEKLDVEDISKIMQYEKSIQKTGKAAHNSIVYDNVRYTTMKGKELSDKIEKDREKIKIAIEKDYNKPYEEVTKNMSDYEKKELINNYTDKLFLTTDNIRWHKFEN